jgi:hypothetical protein
MTTADQRQVLKAFSRDYTRELHHLLAADLGRSRQFVFQQLYNRLQWRVTDGEAAERLTAEAARRCAPTTARRGPSSCGPSMSVRHHDGGGPGRDAHAAPHSVILTDMGLDTFPSRAGDRVTLTPEDDAALAALDLPLCEWIGAGSFRGKVYLDIVYAVAGMSLCEDWIPPQDVARLAAAFEACDPEAAADASKDDHYPVTAREVRALRDLFRLCADRGIGLLGWW